MYFRINFNAFFEYIIADIVSPNRIKNNEHLVIPYADIT